MVQWDSLHGDWSKTNSFTFKWDIKGKPYGWQVCGEGLLELWPQPYHPRLQVKEIHILIMCALCFDQVNIFLHFLNHAVIFMSWALSFLLAKFCPQWQLLVYIKREGSQKCSSELILFPGRPHYSNMVRSLFHPTDKK